MSIGVHEVFGGIPEAFLEAFGADCLVTIGAAAPVAVRGILRAPHGQIAPDAGFEEPGVDGSRPTASFAEADVPGLADGHTVVHAGVTWTIRNPLPDGRGMVRCELERAE